MHADFNVAIVTVPRADDRGRKECYMSSRKV